jgi:DNA-directed RNA polymerases I, II, and III subunit RPABC1
MNNQSELRRLFIVYSTLCDTLRARGYNLPSLPITQKDFDFAFGQGTSICREDLTFFATKPHDPTSPCEVLDRVGVVFVSSCEKKAISIQQVRCTIAKLRNHHVVHGIIVHEQTLSPGARKLLIESNSSVAPNSGPLYIETFDENQLLFNTLEHELVPEIRLLSKEERKSVCNKYRVNPSQLPHIVRNDPMARLLGMNKGDMMKIVRPSETAGEYTSYRVCT